MVSDTQRPGPVAASGDTLRLREGQSVAAREVVPSDAAAIRALFAGLSAGSLAMRSHSRPRPHRSGCSDDGLVLPRALDIAVVIVVEGGLVARVVHAADMKGLDRLGPEIADLLARAGRLEASEVEGAVIAVTNLGGYRIDAFTPLLDPPQTAILGVGCARLRATLVGGEIMPRGLVVLRRWLQAGDASRLGPVRLTELDALELRAIAIEPAAGRGVVALGNGLAGEMTDPPGKASAMVHARARGDEERSRRSGTPSFRSLGT